MKSVNPASETEIPNGKLPFNKYLYDDRFMFRVRKKPILVKAIQVTENFEVETDEGIMKGKAYDYLVRGVRGELYPVDREIFLETYELPNGSNIIESN